MGEVLNYMHPLTVEAKVFVNTINKISNNPELCILDAQLAEAFENVMATINDFLEKANTEVVQTENTQFIDAERINFIQRSFRCKACRSDLGAKPSNVVLHLSDDCSKKITKKPLTIEQRKEKKAERKEQKEKIKQKRLAQAVVLKKKARLFLSMDAISSFEQLSVAVQIGDKLKCIPEYKEIENDLLELLKPMFPNESIRIYKFGSRMSGIGTRDSDLDLFIDIGDTFKTYQNRATDSTLAKLNRVDKALKNHKKSWKSVVAVKGARVPILKVLHASTSIECDINFSNSLGHINTKLMEYIYGLQPTVRVFCIYIKKWLNLIGMKNEFNTYTLILMAVFYLQTLNYLPAFSKLFDSVDTSTALMVGPWCGTFVSPNLQDLKIKFLAPEILFQLVEGFFKYYIQFDYANHIICPYKGEVVAKSELNNCMPERYMKFVANAKDLELASSKPMVVQDPIQLNHNTTKGISEFTLKVFREFMVKSLPLVIQSKKP
ncbi:tailor [Musca autumnalis]|uniref:tailor n=1 Tax=Musca autumnalis TaxID=221902 RepID=UPI003CE87AA7